MNLASLQTEQRDPATVDLDRYSTEQLLYCMNKRDHAVLDAVHACIGEIARAVDQISPRIRDGGRLIYIGAGTSGRLGILDAAEVPPTFSAPVDQFVALIAGGEAAIRTAQEGAEDSKELARADLDKLNLATDDAVIGIAASGRTPYVQGGLEYAREKGLLTVGVVCVSEPEITADIVIKAVPGPEIITGSTRLKAGTATKLVLNMISTSVMIKIGKTYGNLMIDLKPTNAKLRQRSKLIFRTICSPEKYPEFNDDSALESHFEKCKFNLKVSVLSVLAGVQPESAQQALDRSGGVLEKALAMTTAELNHVANHINGKNSEKNLILVVDGGGSKTSALVRTKDGEIFRGLAGPSNTATHSVQYVVDTITTAVENCLKKLDNTVDGIYGRFDEIWIGLAGYLSSSQSIKDRLDQKLTQLFGISTPHLKISGDSTLLAGSLEYTGALNQGISTCITAIAGTGSSTMAFKAMTDVDTNIVNYELIARLGGLGPILGDEAGGYGIGLSAIKSTLRSLDLCKIKRGPADGQLSPMQQDIIRMFNSTNKTFTADILRVISGDSTDTPGVTKIAAVARLVLQHASTDVIAKQMVSTAIDHLVNSVDDILQNPYISAKNSLLVLGGSLYQQSEYQTLFKSKLAAKGLIFHNIICIQDAPLTAAKALALKIKSRK